MTKKNRHVHPSTRATPGRPRHSRPHTTVAGAAAEQLSTLGVAPTELPAQQAQEDDFSTKYDAAMQKGGAEFSQFMADNTAQIQQLCGQS